MGAQQLTQAVAEQLTTLVASLETPRGQADSPVRATIVNDASLSSNPASPNWTRNLGLAALFGLLLGLGAAVLRELLDGSIKDADDVAEVADVPVLGHIARDSGAARDPLVALDGGTPCTEAFRVLRTNMKFADAEHNRKVFAVTSSVPGEGKTTTAMNLAITLAQGGEKVLLLEGDLRQPRIFEDMHVSAAVGLTTVLSGKMPLEDVVQDAGVPNLSVLTCGPQPKNAADLLQSRRMADVLARARDTYDIVVIDTPPLLPVADATLLAAQSDGTLLVVRHGKTTRDQLSRAIQRLDAVNVRLVGVILNMLPNGRRKGYVYDLAAATGRDGALTVAEG
jgi:receptor protein-tyrosine kinase